MAQFEKGNAGGGRPKGSTNKATRDIKDLVQTSVNFKVLVKKLEEKAKNGEKWAFELLFQYGYGRPVEIQVAPINLNNNVNDGKPIQHEHTHALARDTVRELTDLAKSFRRPKAGS